jgi:hypothetical protein
METVAGDAELLGWLGAAAAGAAEATGGGGCHEPLPPVVEAPLPPLPLAVGT